MCPSCPPPSSLPPPNITLHLSVIPPCCPPHSHLDNHSLWEPKVFAIRCFKIIMYSIQVWRRLPWPARPLAKGPSGSRAGPSQTEPAVWGQLSRIFSPSQSNKVRF